MTGRSRAEMLYPDVLCACVGPRSHAAQHDGGSAQWIHDPCVITSERCDVNGRPGQ